MAQSSLLYVGSGKSIIWAILLIVFGVLAICVPLATSLGVAIVLAWLIIFSGGAQFIYAFQSKGAGHIIWKIIVAVLYLIVGLYILMNPGIGAAGLTLALAIFFVVSGIATIVAYFKVRVIKSAGWILFDGIVTLILGVMIWRQWPSSSLWVIGTLVGISMTMSGVSRLMLDLGVRHAVGELKRAI